MTSNSGPEKDTCHQCKEEFGSLGLHWRQSSSCHFPPIRSHHQLLIESILFNRGRLDTAPTTPRFQFQTVRKPFAEYLQEQLGPLVSRLEVNTRSVDFPEDTVQYDSTGYRIVTRSLPDFERLVNRWIDDGERIAPDDYELTPSRLALIYGISGFTDAKDAPCINITARNPFTDLELRSLFHEYDPVVREDSSRDGLIALHDRERVRDTISQSELLPIPGFKDKFGELGV